jgi:hypothetical protein
MLFHQENAKSFIFVAGVNILKQPLYFPDLTPSKCLLPELKDFGIIVPHLQESW